MRTLRQIAVRTGTIWMAGLAVLTGCDSITRVDAPDIIDPTSLESPQGALALRAGALRRFPELFGGSLTTTQFFDTALVHLDSAIALAADSARLLNLARVARGRTLVNLGRFDEAAATVAPVPTGFVYNAEFSASAQLNQTFALST